MIIAVGNEKGGVGKTTVAIHLARYLNATLVDLDPQQTATQAVQDLKIENVGIDSGGDLYQLKRHFRGTTQGVYVLDLPPGAGVEAGNGLMCADVVLLVTEPSFYSALGLASMLASLQVLKKENKTLREYVIINKIRRTREHRKRVREIESYFKEKVIAKIPLRSSIEEGKQTSEVVEAMKQIKEQIL